MPFSKVCAKSIKTSYAPTGIFGLSVIFVTADMSQQRLLLQDTLFGL